MASFWSWIWFRWARIIFFAIACISVCVIGLAMTLEGIAYRPVGEKSYNSYSCTTKSEESLVTDHSFRILDLLAVSSTQLIDELCLNLIFANRYSNVELVRLHRDQVDLRDIVEQKYQLVVTKPELFNRILTTQNEIYQTIVAAADYNSEFQAIDSVPTLSNEYFSGKKIGMLDDPNSLSGYQIPKAVMKEHSLDEKLFTTNYYRSHQRLQQALQIHEVDVIATYSETNINDGQSSSRLILAKNLPGIHWFFTTAEDDQMVICEIKIEIEKYLAGLQAPLKIVTLPESVCSYDH